MKIKAELTKREWLLLSAYLDGELAGRKARQVEELLQSKPASREALEVLRRTRQVLRHAPAREVPCNFTLTEVMLKKPLLPSFSHVLRYSSALAGILLVIVFGLDVYTNTLVSSEVDTRADVESQALLSEADAALEVQRTPVIIQWGGTDKGFGAYGIGGGSDEAGGLGGGIGGGGSDTTVPKAAIDPEVLFGVEESQEAEIEELPPSEESLQAQPQAVEEAQEELDAAPAEKQAEAGEALTPAEEQSGNPILGIHPVDEQGQILTERPALTARAAPSQDFPWRLAEIVLAAAAFLTGLAAWIFRKQR